MGIMEKKMETTIQVWFIGFRVEGSKACWGWRLRGLGLKSPGFGGLGFRSLGFRS